MSTPSRVFVALCLLGLVVGSAWLVGRGSGSEPRDMERRVLPPNVPPNVPAVGVVGEPILAAVTVQRERESMQAEQVEPAPESEALALEDELPEEEVEAPEDPVQTGPCALRLLVVERATVEPVASTVHLFRLDAPENEFYGPGDQL